MTPFSRRPSALASRSAYTGEHDFQARGGRRSNGSRRSLEVHTYVFPASVTGALSSAPLPNGVLERFPKLKLAFLEIGATWLPYWLDRLDEHWELRGAQEMPHVTKRPTDVFREHDIYVSVPASRRRCSPKLSNTSETTTSCSHPTFHTGMHDFPENLEYLESRQDSPSSEPPEDHVRQREAPLAGSRLCNLCGSS